MANNDDQNTSSDPPTWRWKKSKFRGAPAPKALRAAGAPLRLYPSWRQMRRPLWVEIWYEGGNAGQVKVKCRGWVFVFPCDVSIFDVVKVINGGKTEMVRGDDD